MIQIIVIFLVGILGISRYFSLKEKGYSSVFSALCLLAGIMLIIYAFISFVNYL